MQQLFHTASLDAASWLMILTLRLAKFLAVEAKSASAMPWEVRW